MNIAFISLGCPKNQVNCEQMLYQVYEAGHDISLDAEGCDVAVLNSCGFLQEAKEEALRELRRLAELKAQGQLKKIIFAGCAAERYQDELEALCPEADAFLGVSGYEKLPVLIDALWQAKEGARPRLFESKDAPIPETGRVVLADHWAYLRIAEGCDNHCSYCMIPSIRGRFRSRPIEAIVREAEGLAADGIRELILVAQDTTRYGLDLYGRRRLSDLLRALSKVEGIRWLRLHYLYPDELDEELIALIAGEEKIVKYIDIPIQHISDTILKAMGRRATGAEIRALLRKLRAAVPELVIRTSLICGFPGEREEDFEELCAFLREFRLERAGIFPYSPEEGSRAARFPNQIDEEVKRRRLELLTEIQLGVLEDYAQAQLGKTIEVLCEEFDPEAGAFAARSGAESPGIDGQIYLRAETLALEAGCFYRALVTEVCEGELWAEAKEKLA